MSEQTDLRFGGSTYDPVQDGKRLAAQLEVVRELMLDSKWRTLDDIARVVGAPEASISARLRDLRKKKFGGHAVERRRIPGGNGLHEYRVLPPAARLP